VLLGHQRGDRVDADPPAQLTQILPDPRRTVAAVMPGEQQPDQRSQRRPACVYLAIMSLDPTGKGRTRWTNRWKAALNAFEITFDGRLSAGRR
jgi:hypothetical protein